MRNFILILVILLFAGCNKSDKNIDVEKKYNIYISKLSDEEIAENLKNGLKPIAVKDNIDVVGFANTAGSKALENNFPNKNAFLAQKLIDNGYFVIGKTNLSEWANFRSSTSTSGLSSMGGQTINPYGLDKIEEYKINTLTPRKYGGTLSWLAADGDDEEQTDGIGATEAIKKLDYFAKSKIPFFLAVGFFRPHTPFVAPKKYFDLYDREKIEIPEISDDYLATLPKPAAKSIRAKKNQLD